MRNTLLIHLKGPQQDVASWTWFDGTGAGDSETRTGTLEQAASAAAGRRVVVLVPSVDILLTHAQVPSRNRQRVLKAVPYVLEDQLAGDVDDLHFALGASDDTGYPVAVVLKQQMDAWLAQLAGAGIQPDALLPDMLALPQGEGYWGLWVADNYAAVRTGPSQGFACERDNLAMLLSLAPDTGEAVPALQLAAPLEDTDELAEFELRDSDAADALHGMAAVLEDTAAIDLLQGGYSRSEQASRLWRPWRATAALLLAAVLVMALSMGVEYYRMGQELEDLQVQVEQVYRAAFPNAKRVVNPRAQMEQRLRALGKQGTGQLAFLDLLYGTGTVLSGTRGVELQGASYRDGRLDLDLAADNLQILDQLKQKLSEQERVMAEIQSATADADRKVKSRMRVSGVGS